MKPKPKPKPRNPHAEAACKCKAGPMQDKRRRAREVQACREVDEAIDKAIGTSASLRLNVYEVITRAVDEGIEHGWRRGHKCGDNPDAGFVKQCVYDAVMHELHEVLYFDEYLDG